MRGEKRVMVTLTTKNDSTESLRGGDLVATTSDAKSWGWLPALSLIGALGLLLVALANTGARNDAAWSESLFWMGLLVLFAPIASRLASSGPSERERIGLVAILGLGIYFVKLLHSPLSFTFHDELLHWRTANDILQSGHLFQDNPLLQVSALYPGLEIVTSMLISLSGLKVFSAGVVVIGLARLVLVLALYLFYKEISNSPRVAGIASLLYMTNPSFLFFDAQFAYESLALTFAALILWTTARRACVPDSDRTGLTWAALLGLGAVVITHHVTSYALVTFLMLWTMVAFYGNHFKGWHQLSPGWITLLALVMVLTWLVYVANIAIGYLGSFLAEVVREIIRLIAREGSGRQLFCGLVGEVAPMWEQLTGYVSVILILLGLPLGLFQIWKRHRTNIVALALAAGALAYPVSQVLRFTPFGLQVAGRIPAFLFLAIAFVLAVGFLENRLSHRPDWTLSAAFSACVAVIFVGGVIIGWPRWARLPGPYLVVADTRSIEPQGVAAAEWVRAFLGPDNRIAADRINGLLMVSYGEQRPVTASYDWVNVPAMFFSSELGAVEHAILQRGGIRYVIVDRRLSSGLPMAGVYFEFGEPNTFQHRTPIDLAALVKFDGLENVSRLFDSGDIVIYDVEVLVDGP